MAAEGSRIASATAAAPTAAVAVELVVAVSEDDVIGRGNALPWRLPADLRHFKEITFGHAILMGRKTHESIGRALPGRRNLVLTRRAGFTAPECTTVLSVAAALDAARGAGPLMVIGGAEIYQLCLPLARRIHLTLVHARYADGDTRFGAWRAPGWREISRERHAADDKNAESFSFVTLLRD